MRKLWEVGTSGGLGHVVHTYAAVLMGGLIGLLGGTLLHRSRLCRQYLATSLVALFSQASSAARRMTSIAANHLGALGAGCEALLQSLGSNL